MGFGIRDPRSEIREKPIPDPGSGSATLVKKLKYSGTGRFRVFKQIENCYLEMLDI
jgi:hypothetical protein